MRWQAQLLCWRCRKYSWSLEHNVSICTTIIHSRLRPFDSRKTLLANNKTRYRKIFSSNTKPVFFNCRNRKLPTGMSRAGVVVTQHWSTTPIRRLINANWPSKLAMPKQQNTTGAHRSATMRPHFNRSLMESTTGVSSQGEQRDKHKSVQPIACTVTIQWAQWQRWEFSGELTEAAPHWTCLCTTRRNKDSSTEGSWLGHSGTSDSMVMVILAQYWIVQQRFSRICKTAKDITCAKQRQDRWNHNIYYCTSETFFTEKRWKCVWKLNVQHVHFQRRFFQVFWQNGMPFLTNKKSISTIK